PSFNFASVLVDDAVDNGQSEPSAVPALREKWFEYQWNIRLFETRSRVFDATFDPASASIGCRDCCGNKYLIGGGAILYGVFDKIHEYPQQSVIIHLDLFIGGLKTRHQADVSALCRCCTDVHGLCHDGIEASTIQLVTGRLAILQQF